MNKTWRLVDLPGYGFADGAKKDSARFNQAVARYLKHRPNLCCVFALIDSGLAPQEIDLEFVEWLARNAVPFVLVFTKTDRGTPRSGGRRTSRRSRRASPDGSSNCRRFSGVPPRRAGPEGIARRHRPDC